MQYDVIIIGGSYAGLSAGLPLARARRRVLVVDAGVRRNRYAEASHGLLTNDGKAPGDIAAQGKAELLNYPTVTWLQAEATAVTRVAKGFRLSTSAGEDVTASRLILALGVVDELPAVPGLAERWGRHVFHCPYCHGYELGQQPVGVLATSELAMHQALMLPDWGPTTLFLNDVFTPDAQQRQALQRRGVTVIEGQIAAIGGERAELQLADGRRHALAGLFIQSRTRIASPLPAQLGCVLEQGPLGAFLKVDAMQQTSAPGVFACGDAARGAGSVPLAVGDGAIAGTAAHRSLMFETL